MRGLRCPDDRYALPAMSLAKKKRKSDPDQVAIWKTVQVLLNQVIYADAYLQEVPGGEGGGA